MFDNILNLINDVLNKIDDKVKEIAGLETDYEELLALKKGLNNILEQYHSSCERDKNAMNDDVFESCRCMQMFRNSMLDTLNSVSTSAHSDNITSAVNSVSTKATAVLNSISAKESELTTLQQNLESYRTQMSAMQTPQEGS